MQTSNPLVEVEFIDNSSYASAIETGDIVGMVVETDWGPVNKFTVCNKEGWKSFSDPTGNAKPNYTTACVDRVFSAGAEAVEVYRLDPKKTVQFKVVDNTETIEGANPNPAFAIEAALVDSSVATNFDENTYATFALKYPGNPDIFVALQPFTGNTANLPEPLEGKTLFRICTYLGSSTNPAESLTVTLDQDVYVDGEPYSYDEVIRTKSQYLQVGDDVKGKGFESETIPYSTLYSVKSEAPDIPQNWPAYSPSDYESACDGFKDRDLSNSTILVSTFEDQSGKNTDSIKALIAASELRMDCVTLCGCPKSVFENADMAEVIKDIKDYITTVTNNVTGRFCNPLAATERYRFKNKTFYLDGTQTLAGRLCSIARQYNRNTLPSYKATGLVDSVLVKSLPFKDVVNLMEECGIGSIYSTPQGNYLFNIRTAYSIQTSYFGKLNVARVTAAFLRWLLTDVEYTIHQDTVSDTLKLLSFEKTENLKLQKMISLGELKSQSVIIANPSNNTDAMTNGGECLNIDAELWFKKLEERVKIKIIATDTTTSVDIS